VTLLYVLPEHPSVSQTFVAKEFAAIRALGIDVLGYALKRGSASQPAAEVALLCDPPSGWALAFAAMAACQAFIAALGRNRRPLPSFNELARLWLAFAHVEHVARRCRQHRVTHVHAHFLGRSADVANELARRLGCQWTVTAHGADVYAPAEPALMAGRLASVAAVACANRGVRARLTELAAPATLRTEVIHCGVDTRALRPGSFAGSLREPHVVTVGRLVATKGYWAILDAATSLLERHKALRWTIVGDGPLRQQLQQDPRSVRLARRMSFTGALDHGAVLDMVATATVFVLPCEMGERGQSDGIPVAIMEAMALGVVVVTTPVGGIAELVIDNSTGFLVQPNDSRQLVTTLERILYSMPPGSLDRIRAAAREKVESEFDLDREAAKLFTLLEPYGVSLAPAPIGGESSGS
jgi:colanic acid/amylovoran biosynthesis glycosyltransferase